MKRQAENETVQTGIAAEVELVRRIQAGDDSAFRELVERFQSRVYSVAYGILRHRENAEDASQEVFAKIYFSIGQFQFRSSLFSWIYRIAVNQCYCQLRKRRVNAVSESEERGSRGLYLAADGRPSVASTVEQRDLLNKLLTRLPERDRLLVLGRDVEGRSVSELAALSGVAEGRLKGILFRIRKRLADCAQRGFRSTPSRSLAPLCFACPENSRDAA